MTPDKIEQLVSQLSESDQKILLIMTLYMKEVPIFFLERFLFSNDYQVSKIVLQGGLKRLDRKQLIHKRGNIHSIRIEDGPFILRSLIHSPMTVSIAEDIQRETQYDYWSYFGSNRKGYSLMLIGLALQDMDSIMEGYVSFAKFSHTGTLPYLVLFFNTPDFKADLLRKFNKKIQVFALTNLLDEQFKQLKPAATILSFTEELVKTTDPKKLSVPFTELLLNNYYLFALVQGKKEVFQSPLPITNQALQFDLELYKAAFEGNFDWVRKVLDAQKKRKKWKTFLKDKESINKIYLYLFSLIKPEGIDYQAWKQNEKEVYEYLLDVDQLDENAVIVLSNYIYGREEPFEIMIPRFSPGLLFSFLFAWYAQYWSSPHLIDYTLLESFYTTALKNNYQWLALHLGAILTQSSYKDRSEYEAEVKQLKESLGVSDFTQHFPDREPWELTVEAFQIFEKKGDQQTQNTRLIWLVDFEQFIFEPRLQKAKKSGGWTKGRRVSMQKLADGFVDEASPQDQKIAAGIYDAYGGMYHNFNPVHLIDHPYLFLERSPATHIEFSQKEPVLHLEENDQYLELFFVPDLSFAEEPGELVHKATPTQYQYIMVNQDVFELSQMIGKKLRVPIEKKDFLLDHLHPLKEVVTIQSTIAEALKDIKPVENDPRIYVHLLPVGEGFQLEFFVKPLGIAEPYFKPATGNKIVVGETEEEKIKTERDLKAEKKNAAAVRQAIPLLAETKPKNGSWMLEDAESCLNVLVELERLKKEDKIVLEWPKGEKLRINHYAGAGNFDLSIRERNNWFELDGKLQLSENLVLDMSTLLQKVRESQNQFIEISEGQFLALTKKFQQQLKALEGIADQQKGLVKIHPLAGGILEELEGELRHLEADAAWRLQVERLRDLRKKRFRVPKAFEGTLRDYQKEGYIWLRRLEYWGVGGCLADDMGLGKTIQSLALMQAISSKGPCLVVAPASVCRNWINEAQKFTPEIKAYFYNEEGRQELLEKCRAGDLIVMTYGLMQQDIKAIADVSFAAIVLDEAQAIKNRAAKRTKAAMLLNGNFKLITTGTPIENHLGELWTLFNFINPGLLGSRDRFVEKFARPIEQYKDETTYNALRKLIQPFILRRLKSNVLSELPEKTEIQREVILSEKEAALYESMRREAVEELAANKEEKTGEYFQIFAALTRLRQLSCHPNLVDEELNIKSSKLELLIELLEELRESGHKVLVFSQFVKFLKLIEKRIKKHNFHYQYLDGSTPLNKRQDAIDRFQEGEGDVFLISLKAGGTGLNLTAADYVIHVDPWWNPAVENQATDRAHRIGQTKPVTVIRLVTSGTIEEKIMKLHAHKKDLADRLLAGTDVSSKLSADELLELIK